MSFGTRRGNKELRLEAGQVHTNGLGPRFEEHRRITGIAGEMLSFTVTSGKREGREGSCKVESFWLWSRGMVE